MTVGKIDENGDVSCPHCNGKGYTILIDDENPDEPIERYCTICRGTGKINWVDLIVPPSRMLGMSGTCGTTGFSGTSGSSGVTGFSGSSGSSGTSGSSGNLGYYPS